MDIKPFIVRYKAGKDKSILPGIHGRFETREEADRQVILAADNFGGGVRDQATGFIVGRAVVGVVVDQVMLRKQKEMSSVDRSLDGVDIPEPELDEEEKLRAELQRYRDKYGAEPGEESSETEESSTLTPASARR